MQKVSIVMPAHNEEKRIGQPLGEYLNFFSELKQRNVLNFEVIPVLNACKDKTREVVGQFKNKELRAIEFAQGGKGFAIAEGFKEALKSDADLIGFVDADGATPPEAFYDLVKQMKDCDGAIANRWDRRSRIKTRQTLLRRIMSRMFNFYARVMFFLPHRDTQCGAKVFTRKMIKEVVPKLGSSEWSFDVDLLFYMRRAGAKIKSVPTIWEDKKDSHINIRKTPLKMLLSLTRLRLIHSPFRFVVRFYRKLPDSLKLNSYL